jgi:uncharacterized protein
MKKLLYPIALVLLMVSSGAAASYPVQPGNPADDMKLITAAWQGDLKTVESLLRLKRASVHAKDDQGMTALIAAAYRNNAAIAELLLKAGADVDAKDKSQHNAFLIAAREGYLELLKLTLNKGADVNSVDSANSNALHRGGWRGQIDVIKELLKTEIDLNHRDSSGRTPLLFTVTDGGPTPTSSLSSSRIIETVRLLVEAGADATIPDNRGVTPLAHAKKAGKTKIVDILTAGGPSKDLRLITAAWQGDIGMVKRLLAQGASVTAKDEDGKTALIAAADRNNVAIAELLIKAGADVNVKDNTEQSAYLIATAEPYLELLRLTLKNGGDVHSHDSWNGTGLIRAAERGYSDIVKELLKTDIKIDHVNRVGWTALIEASNRSVGSCDADHNETVRLLVEAGANVNLASTSGVSPLAYAEKYGCTRMIEILKKAGAR